MTGDWMTDEPPACADCGAVPGHRVDEPCPLYADSVRPRTMARFFGWVIDALCAPLSWRTVLIIAVFVLTVTAFVVGLAHLYASRTCRTVTVGGVEYVERDNCSPY